MWLIFALLSAIFFAMSGFFIKESVTKADPVALSILWGLAAGIIYLPFINPIITPTIIIAIAIWTAVRWITFYPYKYADLSIVSPLLATQIILVFMLSMVILKEMFTPFKLIGTLLIMFSAIMLTLSKGKTSWFGIFLTLVLAILMAFGTVVDKINMNSNIPVLHYLFMTFTVPSLILFPLRIREVKMAAKVKSLWPSALFYSFGALFLLKAYQMQEASIVYPISWLSILFSVMLGSIILKEGDFKKRMVGALLAIMGMWFLT